MEIEKLIKKSLMNCKLSGKNEDIIDLYNLLRSVNKLEPELSNYCLESLSSVLKSYKWDIGGLTLEEDYYSNEEDMPDNYVNVELDDDYYMYTNIIFKIDDRTFELELDLFYNDTQNFLSRIARDSIRISDPFMSLAIKAALASQDSLEIQDLTDDDFARDNLDLIKEKINEALKNVYVY